MQSLKEGRCFASERHLTYYVDQSSLYLLFNLKFKSRKEGGQLEKKTFYEFLKNNKSGNVLAKLYFLHKLQMNPIS
jgi:hypothetical protein